MLDMACNSPYTGGLTATLRGWPIWPGTCQATAGALQASYRLERRESRRRGSQRCGTRTIGTSSSQSQIGPGNGTGRRAPSTRAEPSAFFLPLGLVSPNWTTRGSMLRRRNASASLWMPHESELTAQTSPRCVSMCAPRGHRATRAGPNSFSPALTALNHLELANTGTLRSVATKF